jgi:MFS family permease
MRVALVVAYPFGMLADRIGRKPTALLAYGGLALSFLFSPFLFSTLTHQVRRNPYLLMCGAIFQLVGGGVQVLLATLYAIAADVSEEKDK